jgi:hypothetical protein
MLLRRGIATVAPLLLVACSALLNLQDDYSLAASDASSGSDGTTSSDGAPTDSHTDATFSEAGVDAASVEAPRLISPLTTATVSTQTPTITWSLPAGVEGAHVEICADRACAKVQQAFDAAGTSAAPPTALTPGVHFIRLYGRTGPTVGNTFGPSYEILVPHRSSPRDTSYGVFPDFDGDGFADIVATGTTHTVNVYPGAVAGPNDTDIVPINNTLDSNDNSPRPAIGDVDGDGYTDLVVGEITEDVYPADSVNQIAIHRGGAGGLSATKAPDWIIHVPTLADGGSVVAAFGETVSIPGDLNGDGYADILVGSDATTNGSEDETGPTFIYFGHADGPSKIPDGQLTSDVTFGFGCDGPIGDVNGDGFTDVICQANGVVFLFKGTATGPSNATRNQLTIPASAVVNGGGFGYLQAGAGDIDGDGLPDMLVGAYLAPRPDDGGPGPGQAYVYRGDTGVGLVTATGPSPDPTSMSAFSILVPRFPSLAMSTATVMTTSRSALPAEATRRVAPTTTRAVQPGSATRFARRCWGRAVGSAPARLAATSMVTAPPTRSSVMR